MDNQEYKFAIVKWIPVSKALPETEGYYLCTRNYEGEFLDELFYNPETKKFYDVIPRRCAGNGTKEFIREDVTYWAEFPETPSKIFRLGGAENA